MVFYKEMMFEIALVFHLQCYLNQIEVAIRAYDPCLSCATHAMGKMPLEVELVNEQNEVVDRLEKRITGDIQRTYP